MLSNLYSIFRAFIKAFLLLKNQGIQMIHSDHPTDTFYLAICAKLLRIPLVWHARVSSKSRLDFFNRILATKIIGVSEAVSARFMLRNGVYHKYITIYNGVDCHNFRPALEKRIRKELGVRSDEKVITTIGQMSTEKGIYDFVEVAKLVLKKKGHCRFWLVGSGEDIYLKTLRKKISNYGLQDYVLYFGYRTDIPAILNSTDVFVSASMMEGFPRVVLEAMACGKPVVGKNVDGVNEAVVNGVTGILAPPENPRLLAHAVLSLLGNDEQADKMGIAGRERVERLFTIEKNVSKIERIYAQVTNISE